jgi:ketosteroid isomerase-like protein
VSQDDLQLALAIFADATRDGELDMASAIEDETLWERNRERIAEDAKVTFVNPSVGVKVMEQEYVGIDGLREGWRNWLAPWDRYRVVIDDWHDVGGGQVLVLVTSTARMRESGIEVPQSAASIFRADGGLIREIRFYLDQAQAREAAGLD